MKANPNDSHWPQRQDWGGRRRAVSTLRHRQGHRQQGHQASNAFSSAQRNYERYLALAREAAFKGDTVEIENCYQHAEHYFRVMRAAGLTDE